MSVSEVIWRQEAGVAGVQELQEADTGFELTASRVKFFIAWKRMDTILRPEGLRPIL